MALRETGSLIALGLLGGLWATAWGHRRAQQPDRTAMLDARTQIQVRLDALRARTALLARRDLPPEARALVDQVVEQEVLVHAVLSRAATPADVHDVEGEIEDALISIEEAAARVGLVMPSDDPYRGLCGIDPGHGLATSQADLGDGEPVAVCDDCANRADEHLLRRREVTAGGRPVAFDEVGGVARRDLEPAPRHE